MATSLHSEIFFHVYKAYFLDTVLTLGSLSSPPRGMKKEIRLPVSFQIQKEFVELVSKKKYFLLVSEGCSDNNQLLN